MAESPHITKMRARNRAQHKGSFLYEDAEWMRDAYNTRGLTLRQIAAEAECGLRTVARWAAVHGIETRKTWPRPSGPDNGKWKGGPVCPRCGGRRGYAATVCWACQDRTGERNPKWRGDDAEYTAVHGRLVVERGRPTEYSCAHCNEPAAEWAYDHADPAEKRNRKGRDDGPYSLDSSHYMPLCVRCHRRFDLSR